MTNTLADLVSETERHLLGGDRDQLNIVPAFVDGSQTAITFDTDLLGIQPGAYVNLDLETMYVRSVDGPAKQATVIRGMLGSTATQHQADTIAYVNPKFSKWDIANAINMELRDLSAPPNGLFQVKTFTLTTKPVQKTYEIPVAAVDLLEILEVRYQPPGAELRWPRVWGDRISIMRNMPVTGSGVTFPNTGMGFRIEDAMYPGRPMTVKYAAPFSEMTDLGDSVLSTAGLSQSQVDIPPLGAAARLMGVREAKRAHTESAVDSRRAGEVPPGSAARAASTLLALLNERIRTEFMRLISTYPQMA